MDDGSQKHSLNNATNSSEQLDDECQLWGRAIRLLSSRQTLGDLPAKERISWVAKGICLPLNVSRLVRSQLLQLCSESDERQSTIDRLEESERHLSTDLRYSQEKMQLYREKLAALQQKTIAAQASLDSARSSAFLESVPDSLLSSERELELLNSKSVASSRAKALEGKVESQEAEIRRLRKKLQELEHSEAERHKRQQEVFRTLKNRKPTRRSPLDNKMLDIIDSYEGQLLRMRLELQGGCVTEALESTGDASDDSAAPGKGYRMTIEQLNQQIASLADQVQCLENEREVLCSELESRPTNSDHVLLISKLNRYERLLKKHNIDASKEAAAAASSKDFSTRIEDIDILPLSVCQKNLREVARLLDIQDLKQMKDAIVDLVSISDAYGVVHPILMKAQGLTQGEGAPPLPAELTEKQLTESDNRVQLLIPALEHWRDQLVSIPELHQSLERLFLQLYPWSSLDRLQAGPDVRLLIAAVDRMASDENYELAPQGFQAHANGVSNGAEGQSNQPPFSMLLGLVEHFRKLFDVNKVSGVCTKMNSVYSELAVCRNAMNSMKEALGLVEQTPMEAVVNAVARLMQLERLTVNDKLQEIFSHEDVQLALDRMDEYDQFFPVFEDLVKKLIALLGVSRVDQILPRVAAYKRVFDSQNEQQV